MAGHTSPEYLKEFQSIAELTELPWEDDELEAVLPDPAAEPTK